MKRRPEPWVGLKYCLTAELPPCLSMYERTFCYSSGGVRYGMVPRRELPERRRAGDNEKIRGGKTERDLLN